MWKHSFGVLVASVLGFLGAPRASGEISFSSAVDLINVSVTVSSRQDAVAGLAARDFVVLENGVPQQIELFSQGDVPLSLALLLDCSGSMTSNVEALRTAARRLVASLRPEDAAEVVGFRRQSMLLQDFTSDHAALEHALDGLQADGDTALRNVLYIKLKDLAARERDPRRRQAIVLFSDGEDTASMVSDEDVLAEARRADITIYTVLLERPANVGTESSRRARYLLTTLARESGGEAFFPVKGAVLKDMFERIAYELRSQYSLSYVPTCPVERGGWRQILVGVKGEGLEVRHRNGYYAGSKGRVSRSGGCEPRAARSGAVRSVY